MEVISDMNLKATELRLGLPGSESVSLIKNNKRTSPEESGVPAPKAQIVGWPPVKSYRKNNNECGMFVKVSMDGAAYLRKIDLKLYKGYPDLLTALESMFKLRSCVLGQYSEREGEYAPAYEDKDGDLMLVGDVPWDMFMSSCKRLRIMKGADARGLGGATAQS